MYVYDFFNSQHVMHVNRRSKHIFCIPMAIFSGLITLSFCRLLGPFRYPATYTTDYAIDSTATKLFTRHFTDSVLCFADLVANCFGGGNITHVNMPTIAVRGIESHKLDCVGFSISKYMVPFQPINILVAAADGH